MRVNVLAKKNGGLLGCTCEVRADAEKAWSSLDAKGESLLECGVKNYWRPHHTSTLRITSTHASNCSMSFTLAA